MNSITLKVVLLMTRHFQLQWTYIYFSDHLRRFHTTFKDLVVTFTRNLSSFRCSRHTDLALDNLVATKVIEEDQRIIAREALLTRHRHHKQKKRKDSEPKRKSSMFPGMDRTMSEIGRSQSSGNSPVSMEQGITAFICFTVFTYFFKERI